MSNCYYISIYDQNILFKNIIDDIIFKHSEGIDLESSKERIKLGDDLFDIVKNRRLINALIRNQKYILEQLNK